MAIYVIGDVQGCFLTLQKLLNEINFNDKNDELIFLGDVINRGPKSLEVLRFIKNHPASMKMVLGNHEVFAIALSLRAIKPDRPRTVPRLLESKEKGELSNCVRKHRFIIKRKAD